RCCSSMELFSLFIRNVIQATVVPVRNERGGITLLLLLLTVSLLTFTVLIAELSWARMQAATIEAEARRTGRTLLSHYDPELLRYGLFGASGELLRGEETIPQSFLQ